MDALWCGKSPFGWDVLFVVGWLRWVDQRPVADIQHLLESVAIPLSHGMVCALTLEFLVRFRLLHEGILQPRLRAALTSLPALCIEVDGLLPGIGQPLVLVVRESIRHTVLLAQEIRSESTDNCRPVAQAFKDGFGDPAHFLSDGSSGIRNGFREVFQTLPLGLDHYHFLDDLGEALLRADHEALRAAVAETEVVAELTAVRRESMAAPVTGNRVPGIVAALAKSVLSCRHGHGMGIPFGRPSLELVGMARKVRSRVKRLVELLTRQNRGESQVFHLDRILSALLDAPVPSLEGMTVNRLAHRLDRYAGWFDGFRDILRPTRTKTPLTEKATLSNAALVRIRRQTEVYLTKVEREGRELGPPYQEHATAMAKRVRERLGELLIPNLRIGGRVLQVPRSTARTEEGNRKVRQESRRRTGRAITGEDLRGRAAELVIAENLRNPWYVGEVLGDVAELVSLFRRVDEGEVRKGVEAYRATREEARGGVGGAERLLNGVDAALDEWGQEIEAGAAIDS